MILMEKRRDKQRHPKSNALPQGRVWQDIYSMCSVVRWCSEGKVPLRRYVNGCMIYIDYCQITRNLLVCNGTKQQEKWSELAVKRKRSRNSTAQGGISSQISGIAYLTLHMLAEC